MPVQERVSLGGLQLLEVGAARLGGEMLGEFDSGVDALSFELVLLNDEWFIALGELL